MARIKALCSERFENLKTKLDKVDVTCKELTGDTDADDYYSIKDATIIFTTPVSHC